MYHIGHISLYVALLLVYSSTPHQKSSHNIEKTNFHRPTIEQELRILKNKFELGLINENEFREQRAKIISKL